MLYSTKSGSWLVIIGKLLLVLYSTISLEVLYTKVKWCYVEPEEAPYCIVFRQHKWFLLQPGLSLFVFCCEIAGIEAPP